MSVQLDPRKAHKAHIVGDILVILTWVNDERALVLMPAHRAQGSPWFIICESAAYKYDNPNYLARQSAQACPMRDKTIPAGGSVVVSPWLIQRHRDTGLAREGHLGQGHEQTTIGAIVVSQQLAIGDQSLHGIEEALEQRRIIDIRCLLPQLLVDLGQTGGAQTILAVAQIDEDEIGLALVGAQLRRDRIAHIFHAGEGTDDE